MAPGTILERRFARRNDEPTLYAVMAVAIRQGPEVVRNLVLSTTYMAANLGTSEMVSMVLKESIFEEVRTRQFTAMPSRIGGIFLSPSFDEALKFQRLVGDRPHIFVCAVEGDVSPQLDCSYAVRMNVLAPIEEQLSSLEQNAVRYWSGMHTKEPIWELITHGKVTIKAPATQ